MHVFFVMYKLKPFYFVSNPSTNHNIFILCIKVNFFNIYFISRVQSYNHTKVNQDLESKWCHSNQFL